MSFLKFALAFAVISMVPGLLAQQPTSTTLAISSGGTSVSTVKQGALVTLTARVTDANGLPVSPGQVEFCEVQPAPRECTDIFLVATEQLSSSGTASYNFLPGAGTHTYQAVFLGTHRAPASQSSAAQIVVSAYIPTTTTVAWTGGSPGNYTLTATVSGVGSLTAPSGSVSFTDTNNGNYVLATVPLVPQSSFSGLSFTSVVVPFLDDYYQVNLVQSADFNGDGKPDLVWTPACMAPLSDPGTLFNIFIGNGDGTFAKMPPVPVYGLCNAPIVIADFNGDGKPDLAMSGDPDSYTRNYIHIFLGNGDGTFTTGQTINGGIQQGSATGMVGGDFNGDGIQDLIAPSSDFTELATLTGNGDGTFVRGIAWPAGVNPEPVLSADFNHDGKLDLVVLDQGDANTPSSFQIMLGNGDGTFQPGSPLPIAAPCIFPIQNPTSCTAFAADFDHDGNLDLIVGFSGGTALLLGNGDGTFQGPSLVSSYSPGQVGDLNSDGNPDVVLGATPGDLKSNYYLALGNGNGTFQPAMTLPGGIQGPTEFAIADFNGDGLPDIADGSYLLLADRFLNVELFGVDDQTATAVASNLFVLGSFNHTVEATYSGDSGYQPSSGSISLLAVQEPTALSFTANPSTTSFGQQVLLTAAVTPTMDQNQTASGTVAFTSGASGNVRYGTATVLDGVATLSVTSIPVGTTTLIATYSGDANFLTSGNSTIQVVTGYSSTTVLTSAPNPAGLGESVTLTAAVAGNGTTLVPTGRVAFFDGATQLGSVPLDATGHASYTTSTLALGTHALTATYAADAVFKASSSAPVFEVIIQPDFTFTLGSTSLSLHTYQHTTIAGTLASLGAFADNITLACVNPPEHVTCTFKPNPAALTANGTVAVSFYLDTDSVIGNGSSAHNDAGSKSPISLAFLLCPVGFFALFGGRGRRPRVTLALLAILTLPLALGLGACAGDIITPVPSTTPGTYVIPITATGAVTGIMHTQQLTLTVEP